LKKTPRAFRNALSVCERERIGFTVAAVNPIDSSHTPLSAANHDSPDEGISEEARRAFRNALSVCEREQAGSPLRRRPAGFSSTALIRRNPETHNAQSVIDFDTTGILNRMDESRAEQKSRSGLIGVKPRGTSIGRK